MLSGPGDLHRRLSRLAAGSPVAVDACSAGRCQEGAEFVRDLSALTPPLLMCAAVLFAIGAFLRHEMGRKRPEEPDEAEDIEAATLNSTADADTERSGTGASADRSQH